MKAHEAFPSKYLSAAEVKASGKDVIDFIEYVKGEEFTGNDGRKQPKRVAYLRQNKPFVINNTNWNFIADATGVDDDDNWSGVKVQLGVEKVRFGREMVDSLRVRNAQGTRKFDAKPATSPVPDDEIPF